MTMFLLPLLIGAHQLQTLNGVPMEILSHLHDGVNVTRWFCYTDAKDVQHFTTYWTGADDKALKNLNIQFVRLCVSPDVIYDNGTPNQTNWPFLDTGIRKLISQNQVVLLDLHDNGQMKLDEPGHDNSGFVSFWSTVATTYKGKMEKSLVFELLNEPVFQRNPEVWYALQQQAVEAIRKVDPMRTIMVTSTSWSGIDSFAKMKPLAQANLIYTFHCYDPFFFTHQGASWVGPVPRDFKQIPFPSSPSAVEGILGGIPEQYRETVIGYGKANYDAKYLHDRIKMAMDWGRTNRVPVVLGEFGAYPLVSPPDSRARWFAAMRAAFKAEGTPNAVWGYDDALGLGRRLSSDGSLWLDPVVLRALYGKP